MSEAYRGRNRNARRRVNSGVRQQPEEKKIKFGKKIVIQIICSLVVLTLIYFSRDSSSEIMQNVNEQIKLTLNQSISFEGIENPLSNFFDKWNVNENNGKGLQKIDGADYIEGSDETDKEEVHDIGEILPVDIEVEDEVINL